MSNICVDTKAGQCYKVFITYSGGDGIKKPLDLTAHIRDYYHSRNQHNPYDSKVVFHQIKACINDDIFLMALYNITNETHAPRNNYKERLNHKYPIKITNGGRRLEVSLILLNTIPQNQNVATHLFNLCQLGTAARLADSVLSGAYFFASDGRVDSYYEQVLFQNMRNAGSTQEQIRIAEIINNRPGLYNGVGAIKIVNGFNHDLSAYNRRDYDNMEDFEIDDFKNPIIRGVVLKENGVLQSQFDINKIRMALIVYAKTKRGIEVLNNALSISTKRTPSIYEYQKNQLHFLKKPGAKSNFQTIEFIGEGRYNPTAGYMPGSLIIAHEIGHTQFGGYKLDHGEDTIHGRTNNLIAGPNYKRRTNHPIHSNVLVHENIMRKSYGMDDRPGYRENEISYNIRGQKLHGSAERYKYSYEGMNPYKAKVNPKLKKLYKK